MVKVNNSSIWPSPGLALFMRKQNTNISSLLKRIVNRIHLDRDYVDFYLYHKLEWNLTFFQSTMDMTNTQVAYTLWQLPLWLYIVCKYIHVTINDRLHFLV